MAGFIGNKPGAKYATLTRQTFSTPTGTSHTLSQTVTNSDDLLLYINNVKQNPADYTASGTTLTTASLAGGTEMYCLYYGKTTETVAPPASSVGDSHMVDMAASKLTGALPAISGANLTGVGVGRNAIINGNFDVWQRGTSFTGVTATGYQADRWEVAPATGCTMTISRQAFTAGQTDVPYEPSYFLRADITTAGSANAEISQKIEDVRTFAGQTIMVSFYAKSTAGTQGLNCRMHQDFGSGGSTRVTTGVSVKTLSSSWQKFTFSVALGSISGKTIGTSSYLAFNFYWGNNSTSNDVDLAQVKVEKGSAVTAFEPKSYAEELVLCQRYFTRKTEGTTSQRLCMGENVSATRNDPIFAFNPSLRAAPSLSVNTVGDFLIYSANTTYAATAINPDLMGIQSCNLMVTTGGTMTAGAAGQFVVNSTGATLDFSAEL